MQSSTRFLLILFVVAAALFLGVRAQSAPAPQRPAPEAARIAVLDVLSAVESLFQSDRYTPARKVFQDEQAAAMTKLRADLSEMETRGNAMVANSPEQQALLTAYQTRRDEADVIRVKVEEFNTNQIAEAYRVVIETASALADKKGYTHVIASRTDTGKYIRSSNSAEAVQEILARPVLKSPEGDNITPEVLKELKIEAVPTPAATPAPLPAPTVEKK